MEEINNSKLEQYYNDIVAGKMTLTQAAQQEDISKDYLRKLITNYIGSDEHKKESFFARLQYNKSQNSAKETDPIIMNNIRLYLVGNINIQQASLECHLDEETFKNKVFEQLAKDPALLELYLRNGTSKRDYSQVNTKLIIINMLKNDMNQSEISRELGIPVRTISGWVNKLPEGDKLKELAKQSVYRTQHGIKLSGYQLEDLKKQLDVYIEENNIEELPIDTRSFEERELEKVEKFLEQVYKLEAEEDSNGKKKYTRKDIMRNLGVGMSAIRRAEIKRDNLKLIIEGKNKQEERGE